MLDNNDNTNIDKCEQSGDHSLPGFVCQRVAGGLEGSLFLNMEILLLPIEYTP